MPLKHWDVLRWISAHTETTGNALFLKHNSEIINPGPALLQSCSPCQQEMYRALHSLRNITARTHPPGKPAVPCFSRQHVLSAPSEPSASTGTGSTSAFGIAPWKHPFKMPPEQLGTGPVASQTHFLLPSLLPQIKHTPVFHQAANPLFPLGAKMLYYFFKIRVLHTPSPLGTSKSWGFHITLEHSFQPTLSWSLILPKGRVEHAI